jgi:hypothetical protein
MTAEGPLNKAAGDRTPLFGVPYIVRPTPAPDRRRGRDGLRRGGRPPVLHPDDARVHDLHAGEEPGHLGWSGVPDDLLEEAEGADGGKGFGAEPVHHLQVMADVRASFQVKGAGELLDVSHIRQVRLLEPQDRERAVGPGVAAPAGTARPAP